MTELAVTLTTAPCFAGRVGGLTVPLRLALTAQRAGARTIFLAKGAEALAPLLDDPRLTIPVRCAPADTHALELPANLVVHESTLQPDLASPFAFAPIAVENERDARRALAALLRACRKERDGWTSRYVNRHVSLAITRLLLRAGAHPNFVTLGIVALGLASGVSALRGHLVLGAALLQAQSTLDGCDGELARVTFRESKLGAWLDTIGDDLSNYAFFTGASAAMYRSTQEPRWIAVGAAIVGAGALASALEYRYLARIGSGDLLDYPVVGADSRLAAALQPLFKRDTFILLTLVAAAAGALGPMLIAFAIGAVAILMSVLRTEARLARRLT